MRSETVKFTDRHHIDNCFVPTDQTLQIEHAMQIPTENLRIATVRYDLNFCRIYVSPAYLKIVVIEGMEILGKTVDELWWPTNMSAKAYREILEELMRSGKETEVRLEWTDSDGHLLCYIEKLMPEYDEQGEIVGVSVLVIDISTLRRYQILENKRQQVFEKLAHANKLEEILEQVALYVESAIPDALCSILVLDEMQNRLETVIAPSFSGSYKTLFNSPASTLNSGCCSGWETVVALAERVVLDDLSNSSCMRSCQAFLQDMGVVACWSEPIFSSTRQLQGVLCLYFKQTGSPNQDDSALLLQGAVLCSLSIERKQREQLQYSLACYDPLTNLPNRRLLGKRLHEEINKAQRGNYGLALLFIDLDRFKEVNDTWGHHTGDVLLMEATKRIQACVRESDTVARLGGDEFVIILPQTSDPTTFERVAQNIVSIMQKPFDFAEHSAEVSASVGIALYPNDAADPETLIDCADRAMYASKKRGRNTYSIMT